VNPDREHSLPQRRRFGNPSIRWTVAAVLLAAIAAIVSLLLVTRPAPPPRLLVGVDDDSVKWLERPDGPLAHYRRLGVHAVRLWIPWHGEARPHGVTTVYLERAQRLADRDVRVVLAVFGFARNAPTTARAQRRYCAYARRALARVPSARDVVVWNEANSPAYWPADAGPAAYAALLGRCWDALHAERSDVNVIDSTASAHDPASFLRALGAAYRASGRTRPLVDTFGHNPYPLGSHDGIGLLDHAELLATLRLAFAGTGQPRPGEDGTTVWYLEHGVQTSVPRGKRGFYYGRENAETLAAAAQARQVADALRVAACQPDIGAFFNFELVDEDRLWGWQSGLLWRDGTRKPAYAAFQRTTAAIESGGVDCEGGAS
jgi:hypothetical protein